MLDQSLLEKLQDILREVNPYAQTYKHVGDVMKCHPSTEIHLVIHVKGCNIDPQRDNLPTGTDITVLMPADIDTALSHRDIVLYKSAKDYPLGREIVNIDENIT